MEGKKLEGDMKGFVRVGKTILEISILVIALGVIFCIIHALSIAGILDLEQQNIAELIKLLIVACFFAVFGLYILLYTKKYHYTITETEITVVSLFGTKVLPIEKGLTYSQKPINPSWHLITVNCNNQKINIRTKTEKEVLEFLAEYGTEVD